MVVTILAAGPGCKQTGVGDPCRPEAEYNAAFNGFSVDEVFTESKSYQCQTRLCLVNHFQGRTTCPYGQQADGSPPVDSSGKPIVVNGITEPACTLPGTTDGKVTGVNDPTQRATVPAQCSERQTDDAVYCSCRCANADGKTDDGANYCSCPDGFSCTQLVAPVGTDTQLAGGYCVKANTAYNKVTSTCTPCDANHPCATDNTTGR